MTSKNLFFKLLRESSKRSIWIYALAILGFLFVLPIATLISVEAKIAYMKFNMYDMNVLMDTFEGFVGNNKLVTGITIIGAIICASSHFFYVSSKKQVDFYHSIPVKREVLFGAKYVCGLLNYVIPYVIMLVITLLIGMSKGVCTSDSIAVAWKGFGMQFLGFLLIYHTTIVAIMLTGNFIVSLLAMGVLGFYGMIVTSLFQGYCVMFFKSYYLQYQDAFIGRLVSPLMAYLYLLSEKASPLFFVGAIVAAMLLLAAGVFLYRIRPSEAAGGAMVFRKTEAPIKIALVVLASLSIGLFFQTITYSDSYGWLIFGLIIGLLLSHAVVEMIYRMDFRGGFTRPLHLVVSGGIVAVFALCMYLDVFGYDTYLPEESEISYSAVAVYGADSVDYFYIMDEDGIYQNIDRDMYLLENMKLTNTSEVLDLAENGIAFLGLNEENEKQESRISTSNVVIQYTLTNGRTICREYTVPQEEAQDFYKQVFGQMEWKEAMYPILNRNASYYCKASIDTVSDSEAVSNTEKEELIQAYQQDVKEATFETLKGTVPIAMLNVEIDSGDGGQIPIGYYIYDSYANTIAWMKEHNLPTEYKVDVTDIASINISNYMYWDESEEDDGITYTDPEQIEQIMQAAVISNCIWGSTLLTPVEDSIYITPIYNSYEDNNKYLFLEGKVPDFVTQDLEVMQEK